MKIKFIIILLCLFTFNFGNTQIKELKGVIIANGDLEGIHVLNKTSKLNVTTNEHGVFNIVAKIQDTILFSSVQYEKKIIVISQSNFERELFTVTMKDRINKLDEVVVGKVLTGDLNSDIRNSDAKRDINFYDLGIPGYTGPPKTLRERALFDADGGKWVSDISSNGLGAGGAINFNKLLNKISGRTKKLKRNVDIERRSNLLKTIREQLTESFFSINTLDEKYRTDFFYFCSNDKDFLKRCGGSEIESLEFLREKLKEYKLLIENNKD